MKKLFPYWLLSTLLLFSCAPLSTIWGEAEQSGDPETSDFSCSYFYFLWGNHAEYEGKFSEALDAYEKALVCDPSADYIKRKLPLLQIKTGETDQAIDLLQQEIKDDPQDTSRRTLLARIFIQQNDNEAAINQYEAIISYDPDHEQTLFRLGSLLSRNGDYDPARTYLNRVLELNPEAYYAHIYLARIAKQLEETDDAELHYRKALELNWSADLASEIASFYSLNNQYRKSIDLLRTSLEEDETDEQARLGIVQALLALDREEAAIAELGLARQYSNEPERISLVLSRLYLKIGNDQKAVENLQAILEVKDSPEARYMLAAIYADEGRFNKALETLDGITPEQQEFEDMVFLKTRILHQTGRTLEAIELLEDYLAQEKTRRPVFYSLGASLYHDIEKPGQGVDLLARGLTIYPEDERVLFDYGLQLERAERLDEAIEVMQRLIIINPDHADALNFIGYSWADTNRNLEQALDYIVRALEIKPGNAYIQDSLGWAYFRMGELERARIELLGALKLLPEDPHVHDHLGDVYRALGQVDKALASYRAAHEKFDREKKKDAVQKKIDDLDTD